MKKFLCSLLFISLIFFNGNLCFADYYQDGYCSETEYYQLKAQYDAILQRMQAANPYTRMGQMAPLKVDEHAYVKAAQLTNYGLANANTLNPQSFTPRDFQAEQMRVAQARQLAQLAAQTGLTPEQYLQGQAMNYNTSAHFYQQQMQQYADLMTQCLKNMRRYQYNNY